MSEIWRGIFGLQTNMETKQIRFFPSFLQKRRKLEKGVLQLQIITFKDIYVRKAYFRGRASRSLEVLGGKKSSSRRDRIPCIRPRFPRTFPSFGLSSPQQEQQLQILHSQQERLRLRQAFWHPSSGKNFFHSLPPWTGQLHINFIILGRYANRVEDFLDEPF